MELNKLLEPMEYKMRTWPWGSELAYITARQAQDRLDEVCWPWGWKVEYKEIKWELFAWVSIKIDNEWITKWDWGTESNIEKEKWLISDTFKRACVTWGVWRFLYSIKPTQWAKKEYVNNDNLKWIAQENIDNLAKLIKEWKTFTYNDVKAKYKISKANRTKLEWIWIK